MASHPLDITRWGLLIHQLSHLMRNPNWILLMRSSVGGGPVAPWKSHCLAEVMRKTESGVVKCALFVTGRCAVGTVVKGKNCSPGDIPDITGMLSLHGLEEIENGRSTKETTTKDPCPLLLIRLCYNQMQGCHLPARQGSPNILPGDQKRRQELSGLLLVLGLLPVVNNALVLGQNSMVNSASSHFSAPKPELYSKQKWD